MTDRNRIGKYDKFGLQLTEVERKLILDGVASLPQEIARTIEATPPKQPIMMTLDDWRELAGHIASEANDTGDKKLQRRLDTIFTKIQDLLDSHTDEGPSTSLKMNQPLAEESVQLAEWAARMLISAEHLGIKTKPIARFSMPRAQRAMLLRRPIISAKLQEEARRRRTSTHSWGGRRSPDCCIRGVARRTAHCSSSP